MKFETIPILPEDYPIFNWSRFQSSYNALHEGGEVADFKKEAWNAIVDSISSLVDEVGLQWDDKYASLFLTKVTASYGAFFADQFNSAVANIDNVIRNNWRWSFDRSFRGYIGRQIFKGDSKYGENADLLYPEYIKELVRWLNVSIEVLRGTAPVKDVFSTSRGYSVASANFIQQPSFPIIGSGLSFSSSAGEIGQVESNAMSYKKVSRTASISSAKSLKSEAAIFEEISRSISSVVSATVGVSLADYKEISKSIARPFLSIIELIPSFANLFFNLYGRCDSKISDLENIFLNINLFRDICSTAGAILDEYFFNASCFSFSVMCASGLVDDYKRIAFLNSNLILSSAFENQKKQSNLLRFAGMFIGTSNAGYQRAEGILTNIPIDFIGISLGKSEKVGDVIIDLQSIAKITANCRKAKAESAYAFCQNELFSIANAYAQAILFGRAMDIAENICNAALTAAGVERGHSDSIEFLIVAVRAKTQKIADILLHRITEFIGTANGKSQGIDNALMHRITEFVGILNAKSQGLENLLLKLCEPLVGTASPKMQGFEDIRIQLGYEPNGTASPEIHAFEKILIAFGYEPNSKFSPEMKGFESIKIQLGYESVDVVSPDVQEPIPIIYGDITESIVEADGDAQGVEITLMETSTQAIGATGGETFEVPSQRGKILRIPTAYSATQNGNVLVVI